MSIAESLIKEHGKTNKQWRKCVKLYQSKISAKSKENYSNSKAEVELDSKVEGLIQEVETAWVEIFEYFTDLAKTAQTPLKGLQLYPPEKCRHKIEKIRKGEKGSSFMHVCNFEIFFRKNDRTHGPKCCLGLIRIILFQPKPSFFEEFKMEWVNLSKAAWIYIPIVQE